MRSRGFILSKVRGVAICGLVALLFGGKASASLRLPHIFSDHMVVQRGEPVTVWGWAEPGQEITVAIGGHRAETTTSKKGDWLVRVGPVEEGGPYEMTVAGKDQVRIEDILVGEVWLCSGQSNMEWPLRQTDSGEEAIQAAEKPTIRLFNVPRTAAVKPRSNVDAQWRVCSPETVADFSAVGYFFGEKLRQELEVPVGLIGSNWGGTRIEPWTPPEGFGAVSALDRLSRQVSAQQEAPHNVEANRQIGSHLYNGMIYPLVPFGLQGAIWYQGESNLRDGWIYHEKMKGLIRGWRHVWAEPNMPFYYVQLAPYDYGDADPQLLPHIWEAQLATLEVPHTGMAVTTDIGNLSDIHPRNKKDVGHRLARWALAQTYGNAGLVYSGPLYDSMEIEEGRIRIHFKHAQGGLKTLEGDALSEFEIAGNDKRFVDAKAQIDGESVVVWSDEVKHPLAVRFAWHDRAQPNLVNEAGLPASPFRTDQW